MRDLLAQEMKEGSEYITAREILKHHIGYFLVCNSLVKNYSGGSVRYHLQEYESSQRIGIESSELKDRVMLISEILLWAFQGVINAYNDKTNDKTYHCQVCPYNKKFTSEKNIKLHFAALPHKSSIRSFFHKTMLLPAIESARAADDSKLKGNPAPR